MRWSQQLQAAAALRRASDHLAAVGGNASAETDVHVGAVRT